MSSNSNDVNMQEDEVSFLDTFVSLFGLNLD